VSLPYVLVADADGRRTAICIEAIAAHGTGVLVAKTGDEAIGVLRDFGTPLLLIVDLLLPGRDGFSVIEAARQAEHERTAILAWSSARELREFAVSRLAGMDVRFLRGSVAPTVIQSAIDHLLTFRKTVDTVEQSQATAAESRLRDDVGVVGEGAATVPRRRRRRVFQGRAGSAIPIDGHLAAGRTDAAVARSAADCAEPHSRNRRSEGRHGPVGQSRTRARRSWRLTNSTA
jgi:CheY-like chemotaxis protein